jgi:hypothetical protein
MLLCRICNITLILWSWTVWDIISRILWACISFIVLRRAIRGDILRVSSRLVLGGIRLVWGLFLSWIRFWTSFVFLSLSLISIYWGAIHLFWSLILLAALILIRCLVLDRWGSICILCLVLRRIISWLFICLLSRTLRCLIQILLQIKKAVIIQLLIFLDVI